MHQFDRSTFLHELSENNELVISLLSAGSIWAHRSLVVLLFQKFVDCIYTKKDNNEMNIPDIIPKIKAANQDPLGENEL